MSKHIDVVDLVRRIRDDIYEQTKGMSIGELVEFFGWIGEEKKR